MAATPPDSDSVDAPPKKGKLLFILLPVLALTLGSGGGYFFFTKTAEAAPTEEAPPEPETPEFGVFTNLPGVIVNPAGTGGRRYLMADIALEVEDEKAVEGISEREVVIRDVVVQTLSEKTVEELAALEARDALKDTLLVRVNELLEADVTRLYFTQYVLQ